MPQLQKPLQGLARFLGLQSQGSLAVNWTPDLVPTYDLGDWIGAPLSNQARSTTVPQNGTFSLFTVPQGETWLMHFMSVFVVPPGAVTTDSYLRLLRSGSTHGQVLAPETRPTVTSVGTNAYMHRGGVENGYSISPRKLFLFGGDEVFVRLQGGSGAGNTEVRGFWQYQNRNV